MTSSAVSSINNPLERFGFSGRGRMGGLCPTRQPQEVQNRASATSFVPQLMQNASRLEWTLILSVTLVQIRIWDFEAKKAEHLVA